MLTSSTLTLLNFLSGVLIGIYLPLVGLYFLRFVRKTPFGFRLVWKATLGVVLVLFGFFSLLVALVALLDSLGGLRPESSSDWFGFGVIFAFFTGTILFSAGLWKAWRAHAVQRWKATLGVVLVLFGFSLLVALVVALTWMVAL
jgi:hypothetical protein